MLKVYFNLHKHKLSVMNAKTRKVIKHCDLICLVDVTFKVSQAGRARVLATKRKNIHAYVCGEESFYGYADFIGVYHGSNQYNIIDVTYNPYKFASFVDKNTGEAIHKADVVIVYGRRIMAYIKKEALNV